MVGAGKSPSIFPLAVYLPCQRHYLDKKVTRTSPVKVETANKQN
jgi:hypothetical protein